jgi:hypothetical protein
MKITKNLPTFLNQEALIMVTGRQEAVGYQALDGQLTEIFRLIIPKLRLQEKEGRFESRVGGKVIRSGGVYEADKREVEKKLIKEIVNQLKKLSLPKEVYLFSPAEVLPLIEKKMSINWRKKIVMRFVGNFYRHHPFKILGKIKDRQEDKKVVATDEEAIAILKRRKNRK